MKATKQVFFSDETVFYVNPLINNQNSLVWSKGKQLQVTASRLLVKRAPHVNVVRLFPTFTLGLGPKSDSDSDSNSRTYCVTY